MMTSSAPSWSQRTKIRFVNTKRSSIRDSFPKMPIVGVAFRMNSYQSFKSIEEIGTYTGKELPKGKKIGVILANTRKA